MVLSPRQRLVRLLSLHTGHRGSRKRHNSTHTHTPHRHEQQGAVVRPQTSVCGGADNCAGAPEGRAGAGGHGEEAQRAGEAGPWDPLRAHTRACRDTGGEACVLRRDDGGGRQDAWGGVRRHQLRRPHGPAPGRSCETGAFRAGIRALPVLCEPSAAAAGQRTPAGRRSPGRTGVALVAQDPTGRSDRRRRRRRDEPPSRALLLQRPLLHAGQAGARTQIRARLHAGRPLETGRRPRELRSAWRAHGGPAAAQIRRHAATGRPGGQSDARDDRRRASDGRSRRVSTRPAGGRSRRRRDDRPRRLATAPLRAGAEPPVSPLSLSDARPCRRWLRARLLLDVCACVAQGGWRRSSSSVDRRSVSPLPGGAPALRAAPAPLALT